MLDGKAHIGTHFGRVVKKTLFVILFSYLSPKCPDLTEREGEIEFPLALDSVGAVQLLLGPGGGRSGRVRRELRCAFGWGRLQAGQFAGRRCTRRRRPAAMAHVLLALHLHVVAVIHGWGEITKDQRGRWRSITSRRSVMLVHFIHTRKRSIYANESSSFQGVSR